MLPEHTVIEPNKLHELNVKLIILSYTTYEAD